MTRSWGYLMWEELSIKPFLKHSNHWKRVLKMNFKRRRCSQFSEAVITSTVKESLRSTELGSIQVLADLSLLLHKNDGKGSPG